MTRGPSLTLPCLLLWALPSAQAAEFSFDSLTLTVADGFTVERAAAPPLVDRPIMADFDEQGRLYVADSSGSNAKVEVQLEEKPHRVVRLEDTDGDGNFDSQVVFADRLMFPEGVLWADGSLYVAAPPVIWKLTDIDGDGVCDEREVWHDGKTLTGCANDLHGPYLGPDGWIYWCKGAFAEQSYPRAEGSPFVSRASHIFRKRPGGGPVEAVMTGGMDNPIEVVFSPEGERFFTTTFLQHPGGGRRDGIIHAIYGGVYGKEHGVLDGHPRTGGLMPVMTHHGPAASCALARYESEVFGPDYRGNLFATLFNMRQVTRHVLTPAGATFQTRDEVFLSGDHIDFHPTDVLEDADGSLLVIDTGGWYKLCCPTSQLPKPEVLGAIYRVRRTAAPSLEDPRGLALNWEEASVETLVARLDDPRPAVWKRAMLSLRKAERGPAAGETLPTPARTESRQRLLWTLTPLTGPSSDLASQHLVAALEDPAPEVIQTALHGLAVRRERAAADRVAQLLRHDSAPVRRTAAEALGRLGNGRHLPALLEALETIPAEGDRVLEHSFRYALMEIGDEVALSQILEEPSPDRQAHALFALQQMNSNLLAADRVLPFLDDTAPSLRLRAWQVVADRPSWALELLKRLPPASQLPSEGVEALAQIAGEPPIQAHIGRELNSRPNRSAALRIARQARLTSLPPSWTSPLANLLETDDRSSVLEILDRLETLPEGLAPPLRALALAPDLEEAQRLQILALLVSTPFFPGPDSFPFLLDRLEPNCPLTERQLASGIVTQMPLDPAGKRALAQRLATTGPLELATLLPYFTVAIAPKDEAPEEGGDLVRTQLATQVFSSLARNPALGSLPGPLIRNLLASAPRSRGPEREALEGRLSDHAGAGTAADGERLQELLNSLPEGDVIRGQTVFNSTEAACATCHAIGYRGGTLGPDLTRIGQVRSRRDLLESILFPSASFVRSYETLLVTTGDGQAMLGILKEEDTHTLTLRTGAENEITLKRAALTDVQPGTLSLMPPGLDTLLSNQQLADLLAFLENTKW